MSIKGPKCARPAEARAAGTVSEPADGPASSLSGRAPFNQVPPEKRDQDGDEAVDGVTVAALTGLDPERVYKTLVTRGAGKQIYVFVIPVTGELDLKKAAKAVGEKSIAMIHVSEINPLTGYVRGGCSPLGMKKLYRTCFHAAAEEKESIAVSAGKIGWQVELAPQQLIKLTNGFYADVITEG